MHISLIIHLLSSLMPDIKGSAALTTNYWRSWKDQDKMCCDSIICVILNFSANNELTRRNIVSYTQYGASIVKAWINYVVSKHSTGKLKI